MRFGSIQLCLATEVLYIYDVNACVLLYQVASSTRTNKLYEVIKSFLPLLYLFLTKFVHKPTLKTREAFLFTSNTFSILCRVKYTRWHSARMQSFCP